MLRNVSYLGFRLQAQNVTETIIYILVSMDVSDLSKSKSIVYIYDFINLRDYFELEHLKSCFVVFDFICDTKNN